jgi:hypothetical protein
MYGGMWYGSSSVKSRVNTDGKSRRVHVNVRL